MRAVFVVAVGLSAVVTAQEPAFRASVEMVTVPVTATSADGRSFGGLTVSDFRVFEDGVAQTVAVTSRERVPVSLCVVLDRSHSMEPVHRGYSHAVIDAIFNGLMPEDEVSLLVFAEQTEVVLPWTPAQRKPRLNWALVPPAPNTSLLDALHTAMGQIEQARHRRSAILLVTDGGEFSSRVSRQQVITTRQQSEALVYAFHVAPWIAGAVAGPIPSTLEEAARQQGLSSPPQSGLAFLAALVGDSGGFVQPLRILDDVRPSADRFLDELRYQYTVGYTPSKTMDGKYRRIRIETSRRGVKLRHRGGYLAVPVQPRP